MIQDFRSQNAYSVLDYLKGLGKQSQVYSCHLSGLAAILPSEHAYIYVVGDEIIIVALDPCAGHLEELADEEPFGCEESPLYFTENSHRESPVWKLAVTIELVRAHLEKDGMASPVVWGILLTSSEILNYDDMTDQWEKMGIKVVHKMKRLSNLSLMVNDNHEMPIAQSLAFLKNATFSDTEIASARQELCRKMDIDYVQAEPDAEELPSAEQEKTTDDQFEKEFEALIDSFLKQDAEEEEKPAKSAQEAFAYSPFESGDEEEEQEEDEEQEDEEQPEGLKFQERQRYLQDVENIELHVLPGVIDNQPCYSDGPAIIKLSAQKGKFLEMDRFSCYIYNEQLFLMCQSTAVDKQRNTTDGGLRLQIECCHIWLPGKYFMLISDSDKSLVRVDFTLDRNLAVTLGERRNCQPCSLEDVLVMLPEDRFSDWSLLAETPGTRQLRQYAVKSARLDRYNAYRLEKNGSPINYSSGLAIYTRNKDFDVRLLDAFRRSASIGQVLKTVDCSILFDATRPNPYERFNEDYDYFHSNVMCLTNLNSLLSSGGKLIVKKFVEHLSNKDRQNCLWLCGTQQEVNALLDTFPSLNAFIPKNSRLEQEPYDEFELVQLFDSLLHEEFRNIDMEVKSRLSHAILEAFRKGALNGWTREDVRNYIVEDVRPRYMQRALSDVMVDSLPALSVDDLCLERLTSTTGKFEQSLQELEAMVGLEEVKAGITTLANNTRFQLERRRRGLPTSSKITYHAIFTGNPGTGKTTVARQLGRIYHSLGLLSKGDVMAVDRTRLVGRYIGETEENMKAVLEEARGNVLFIDEAYNLYDGGNDRKDYGSHVIDALMTMLTQPNPDMLVVFAGYEKEMNLMLDTNPGLAGRFPYKYHFKDFNAEQLMEIAMRLLQRDAYILSAEAEQVLKSTIVQTMSKPIHNFSNARWVEQYVSNGILPAMANRLLATGSDDYQHIEAEDIRKAYLKFCPQAIQLKTRRSVGFSV